MKDIVLTKEEKRIIQLFHDHEEITLDNVEFLKGDQNKFNSIAYSLAEHGMVKLIESNEEGCELMYLTDLGKAYLHRNPKAKNKFLTDWNKIIIKTIISIITLLLSWLLAQIYL
jgi:hypothetical protein